MENATEKTIKVENSFGKDRLLTKKEYINSWKNHATDYYRLVVYGNPSNKAMLDQILLNVELMADQKFNDVYNQQVNYMEK